MKVEKREIIIVRNYLYRLNKIVEKSNSGEVEKEIKKIENNIDTIISLNPRNQKFQRIKNFFSSIYLNEELNEEKEIKKKTFFLDLLEETFVLIFFEKNKIKFSEYLIEEVEKIVKKNERTQSKNSEKFKRFKKEVEQIKPLVIRKKSELKENLKLIKEKLFENDREYNKLYYDQIKSVSWWTKEFQKKWEENFFFSPNSKKTLSFLKEEWERLSNSDSEIRRSFVLWCLREVSFIDSATNKCYLKNTTDQYYFLEGMAAFSPEKQKKFIKEFNLFVENINKKNLSSVWYQEKLAQNLRLQVKISKLEKRRDQYRVKQIGFVAVLISLIIYLYYYISFFKNIKTTFF